MSHDGSDRGFLGEEFLTWLWFRQETDGGDFDLGERSVSVALDDLLAFAPREADETEPTLRKGTPTRTAEARAALRDGRRLRRAKLIVAEGPQQWSAVLDGPSMGLIGVKLPEDTDAEAHTARERATARIASFLTLHELVRDLYQCFLRDRLRPEYLTTSAEAQAQWMQSGAS